MKYIIIILLTLILAGCDGDFASPTTTDYRVATTTTTTTTTAAAELSQDNNQPLCMGILNIGACNVVQVNTQSVSKPAGTSTSTSMPTPDSGIILLLQILGACFVAWIVLSLGLVAVAVFKPRNGNYQP